MKKILRQFELGLVISLVVLFGQGRVNVLDVEPYLSTNGVYPGEHFKIAIKVDIQDSWHINSHEPTDEFSVPTELRIHESVDYRIAQIHFPPHELKDLDYFDESLALFSERLIILIQGQLTESAQDTVILGGSLYFQACNDISCLAPQEENFQLAIPVLTPDQSVEFRNQQYFSELDINQQVTEKTGLDVATSFAQKGIFLTFIMVFLGGLALNLTPCIYPLIPVTMSYFGGQAVGNKGKRLSLALLYVLGIAITNSILGTVAALSGSLLGSFLANPIVLIFIATILILLALSMFGVYEFGLPAFLTRMGGGSRRGYLGALLMGLSIGIVAAPCIGPFVIGLLTYVATTGNPLIGFSMFFTLSLGLGLPFIFLAFFSSQIDHLPGAGEWMVGVRIIFGFILVGMALYFLAPFIPGNIFQYLFPGYLISAGAYLIVLNRAGQNARGFVIVKQLIAIAAIITGTWSLKPTAKPAEKIPWQSYAETQFQTAIAQNKPIILDFYADWCIPCKELEEITFQDQQVVQMSRQFVLFKVDITGGMSAEIDKLRKQFNVKGVPTIIFINPQGEPQPALRILGFVEPEEFIKKMKAALQ